MFPVGVFSQRNGTDDHIGEYILIFFYISQCFVTDFRGNGHRLIFLIPHFVKGITDAHGFSHQIVRQVFGEAEEIPQIIQCFQRIIGKLFILHKEGKLPVFFFCFAAAELEGIRIFRIQRNVVNDGFAEFRQLLCQCQTHEALVGKGQVVVDIHAFLRSGVVFGHLIFFVEIIQTFVSGVVHLLPFQTDF